jgi:hypothetical protein
MTSPQGSSRGRKFALACEIDAASVRRINHALMQLSQKEASLAMRRGFSKWGRATKAYVSASAPMGRPSSVEYVRGAIRPNVHLKFAVATKQKGFRKGLVQWFGVGIQEISGSYLTPHWYLRWVENGHLIKRKSTKAEKAWEISRGASPKAAARRVIGRVLANPFMQRAANFMLPQAERFLVIECNKALEKA